MNTPEHWETFAVIHPDSDRYAWWQEVFGGDKAPIRSILSHRAILPGLGEVQVYELDLRAITPEIRSRLVASIAKRFNFKPEEVEAELDTMGVPIPANSVTACDTNPAKFL